MPKRKGRARRRRKPEREFVRTINGKKYVRTDDVHYNKRSAENRAQFFRDRSLWAQVKEGIKKGRTVYYVYIYAPSPADLHRKRAR